MSRLAFLLVLLAATGAEARVHYIKSCVVSVGGFCPVETVGATIFGVCLLLFAGFPIRWAIRRYIAARLSADPAYQPAGALMFLYRHSGYAVLGTIGLAITIMFALR